MQLADEFAAAVDLGESACVQLCLLAQPVERRQSQRVQVPNLEITPREVSFLLVRHEHSEHEVVETPLRLGERWTLLTLPNLVEQLLRSHFVPTFHHPRRQDLVRLE